MVTAMVSVWLIAAPIAGVVFIAALIDHDRPN